MIPTPSESFEALTDSAYGWRSAADRLSVDEFAYICYPAIRVRFALSVDEARDAAKALWYWLRRER
jgi:hypothetical protein